MRRIVLTLVLLLVAHSSVADPTGRVYAPGEDAYVLKSAPSTSHAYNASLPSGVGSNPEDVYRSFVRFSLPRHEHIVSAVLKGKYGGAKGITPRSPHLFDFVPDDAWTPATLIWDNQPAASSERIAAVDPATASLFNEMSFDVTELAQREQSGDGWISIRIAASDENDAYRAAKWDGRGDPYRRGFYLELVVSPPPELEPGDIVTISTDGLYTGVVAIDPEERTQKGIAPIRIMGRLGALGVDPRDGTLITADEGGFVHIDQTGNPSPLSDNDLAWRPFYLAASSDGHFYATRESDGPSVVRIDSDTGTREVLTAGGELCMPTGIALDGTDLLVADLCGKLIRVELGSGAQSVIPVVGPLYAPEGIALEPDGKILLAVGDENLGGRIVRIDPNTGTQTIVAGIPFAPGPIAVDPVGTIWVGSQPDRGCTSPPCEWAEFGRVDPVLGSYERILERLDGLGGIALDADGAPLLALTSGAQNARVVRIDPETGADRVIAAPLSWPEFSGAILHLLFDAHRQLLVATDDRILRIDPATGHQSIVASGAGLGCGPGEYCWSQDAALAPDGRLVLLRRYATLEASGERLLWIHPISGAIATRELEAWWRSDQILVERSGAILVGKARRSAQGTSVIQRIDPLTGLASALASGGLLDGIDDLALEPSGAVLVADADRREVLRVDPGSGAVEVAVTGVGMAPARLVVDAQGRMISWGDITQEHLALFDPSNGMLVKLATDPELHSYRTLAVFEPPCANGIDDDGDGHVDLADPGCANASGRREDPQCENGRDDDLDGRVDLDDPQCTSPQARERACGIGTELALVLAAFRLVRKRRRAIQL